MTTIFSLLLFIFTGRIKSDMDASSCSTKYISMVGYIIKAAMCWLDTYVCVAGYGVAMTAPLLDLYMSILLY